MKTEREYQTHQDGMYGSALRPGIAWSLLLAVVLWPCSTLLGGDYRVLDVHDGDTAKVQKEGGDPISVRFAEIDAPELAQPFGRESQKHLEALILHKEVDLKIQTRDRYGRVVARVYLDGRDINSDAVRTGHAWWYRQYSKDASLGEAEAAARRKRLGLWKDPRPTPPWTYRAQKSAG